MEAEGGSNVYPLTEKQAAALRRRLEVGILRALRREGLLDETRLIRLLEGRCPQ